MLLIVTNITQNYTAQKFVLHMNTAVSEVTDILKVLSNAMYKFQDNTLRTGDADLRLYITTVQDG
jgi:hypothetical protein